MVEFKCLLVNYDVLVWRLLVNPVAGARARELVSLNWATTDRRESPIKVLGQRNDWSFLLTVFFLLAFFLLMMNTKI